MNLIKHVILVSTYNHENYIEEALNSIVNQTHQPYKVIISDDCSTDNTYKKILSFKKKYPNLFSIFRNETNIGILENLDFLRKYRGEGDVFSFCAGDDFLDLTCLENINQGFVSNQIRTSKTPSIVVTNSYIMRSNASVLKEFNNFNERNLNPLKKVIRGSMSFRSVGFSRALFFKIKTELDYKKIYKDLGLGYDLLVCMDEVILSEKIIYINKPGAVYRTNSGTTNSRGSNFWKGLSNSIKAAQNLHKINLDSRDNLYLNFLYSAYQFKARNSIKNWFILSFFYLLNFNNFHANNPFLYNLKMLLPDKIIYKIKLSLSYIK